MRLVLALALAGLWPLTAASQAVAPVVYHCSVGDGGARTTPPSPLTFSQFTLHWRPAAGDLPPTLKILHEYFTNAPLTPALPGTSTIAGAYEGEDAGSRRSAVVTATRDDRVVEITLSEPLVLAGGAGHFDVTARCVRH